MPRKPLPRHPVTQPSDQSYRLIALTQGKTAIIDAADFEWLSHYIWHTVKSRTPGRFYAATRTGRGNKCRLWMHCLITGHKGTDHRDGDGLNNRRNNLRPCTNAQNAQNQRKSMVATSRFKGVYWCKGARKWRASIRLNRKLRHLGSFDTEEAAAAAYRAAATELFGEFARF